MIPKSLSASALNVSELCMARYFAEYIQRGRAESGMAASIGTSCHGALETYVQWCYLDCKAEPTLDLLIDLYKMSFMKTFGTAEAAGPEYEDGLDMLKNWWRRTDFNGREVLSVEEKRTFPIKFPDGTEVPFTYIMDRVDRTGPGEYRVVDYKSQRWRLNPGDLDAKIQARVYALAVQILYPDAQKIWVEFDLLRHDPIGIVFNRDDQIATWKYLKQAAKRIYEYNDELAGETLNADCRWCVRKTSCTAVQANAAVGGIFAIVDIDEAIEKRAQLEYQKAAATTALAELDKLLLDEAKARDELEIKGKNYQMNVGVRATRAVDGERVGKVIGPVLFAKYGNVSITLKDVDALLAGGELTAAQKQELRDLIYKKISEPSVKVKKVSPFED